VFLFALQIFPMPFLFQEEEEEEEEEEDLIDNACSSSCKVPFIIIRF
jgi:hypothetical protein